MMNNDRQFAELHRWSASEDWDIFGTLNFAVNHKPSLEMAQKCWSKFWNTVDVACFGNKQPQKRVKRFVFVHLGANRDNPHIHFLAKSPIPSEEFCVALNALWAEMFTFSAMPVSNSITPVINQFRASGYGLHDFWKDGADSFSPQLTHMSNDGIARSDADQRLIRGLGAEIISTAGTALNKHKVLSEDRYNRRSM